ncbi:MAG: DUF86 domain-containing protein [Gemmatimonadetes bacterium]|nr:DUF86 domain-containing protein [Gemmatimonadota bacterium]
MTPLEADLVRRKLIVIVTNLQDLAAVEDLALEEYRRDRFRLKGTERLLQEVVEAASDVNVHVLASLGGQPPQDYYEGFVEMGRRGPLPEELAESLAPSAGLRNRIVHEYDDIDDAIVLGAVGEARRLFPRYVAAIEGFLEDRGL